MCDVIGDSMMYILYVLGESILNIHVQGVTSYMYDVIVGIAH